MTDMLIPDVPDDVIAALDAHAERQVLSRSEYIRRVLAQDAARLAPPSASMTWPGSPRSLVTWLTLMSCRRLSSDVLADRGITLVCLAASADVAE
jgi:ribbon-helix-helix CopG family protein